MRLPVIIFITGTFLLTLLMSYNGLVFAQSFPVISANGFKCSLQAFDMVDCDGIFSDDPQKSRINIRGAKFVTIDIMKHLEPNVVTIFAFNSTTGCVEVSKCINKGCLKNPKNGQISQWQSFKIRTASGEEHYFKNVSPDKMESLSERYCPVKAIE